MVVDRYRWGSYRRGMQLTIFNETYGLYVAKTPSGRYNVSDAAATKYRDTCEIKFTPHMPDGEDYHSIFERVKKIEEEHGSFKHPDQWRWWSYISPSEIGYTHSIFEAQKLIEMLEEGDASLPPFEEILDSGNFKEREILNHYPDRINPTRQFEHNKKSNFRIFLDDGYHLVYDTGPRWHNLMRLRGDHLSEGSEKCLIPATFPKTITDYRKVAARFTIWTIQQRMSRKGKRLYTRLVG